MFRPGTMVVAVAGTLVSAVPAAADFKLERQLSLVPGRFILTTDVGEVSIAGDSSQGASVVVTSRRDDLEQRYDVRFEERAGMVEVTVTVFSYSSPCSKANESCVMVSKK